MLKEAVKKVIGNKMAVFLRTQKYFHENPDCAKLLKANKEFHNKYLGKRCFILGNGPSLNKVDFSLLKDEFTFTVNQLSRRADFHELHTNFHVWVDTRFFNLNAESAQDLELLQVMRTVKTHGNDPVVFYKWEAHEMIKKFRLDEELNIHYFSDVWCDRKKSIFRKEIDCTRLLPWMESVTCYAICLAVYMGFQKIYLLGCDCTGFINLAMPKMQKAERSEYAYDISKNEKIRMEKMFETRRVRDELLCYVKLLDTYELLGEYCKNQKVVILNATDGSLLDCLPKIKLEEVL